MRISGLIAHFTTIRKSLKNPNSFEKNGHTIFRKYLDVNGDVKVTEMFENIDVFIIWMRENSKDSAIVSDARNLIKTLDFEVIKNIIPEEKRIKYTDVLSKFVKSTEKNINAVRIAKKKEEAAAEKEKKEMRKKLAVATAVVKKEEVSEESSDGDETDTDVESVDHIPGNIGKVALDGGAAVVVDKDAIIADLKNKLDWSDKILDITVIHMQKMNDEKDAQVKWLQKEFENSHK